jgi:hypothetical protein
MTARIARLAGAIVVETDGAYYLVGNPKEPCDFARAGFEPPPMPSIDAVKTPYLKLGRSGEVALAGPAITIALAGEAAARVVARRFLIERNGSVSERLWRAVTDPESTEDAPDHVDARWLGEVPDPIWQIVRDAILRCS